MRKYAQICAILKNRNMRKICANMWKYAQHIFPPCGLEKWVLGRGVIGWKSAEEMGRFTNFFSFSTLGQRGTPLFWGGGWKSWLAGSHPILQGRVYGPQANLWYANADRYMHNYMSRKVWKEPRTSRYSKRRGLDRTNSGLFNAECESAFGRRNSANSVYVYASGAWKPLHMEPSGPSFQKGRINCGKILPKKNSVPSGFGKGKQIIRNEAQILLSFFSFFLRRFFFAVGKTPFFFFF